MQQANSLSKGQSRLLQVGGLVILLSIIPYGGLVLLPIHYLHTYFHELAHALAALITGGHVHQIQVFMDGSGITVTSGAPMLAVAPAGYIGSTLLALMLVLAGKSEKLTHRTLTAMAWILGLTLILFVRGDIVGLVAGAFWLVVLIGCHRLTATQAAYFLQFLGIAVATASIRALADLWFSVTHRMGDNDAIILERYSGIPAGLSAFVWVLISLLTVGYGLHRSWKASH